MYNYEPAYLVAGLGPRWYMRATCTVISKTRWGPPVLEVSEKRPNIAGSRPAGRVATGNRECRMRRGAELSQVPLALGFRSL